MDYNEAVFLDNSMVVIGKPLLKKCACGRKFGKTINSLYDYFVWKTRSKCNICNRKEMIHVLIDGIQKPISRGDWNDQQFTKTIDSVIEFTWHIYTESSIRSLDEIDWIWITSLCLFAYFKCLCVRRWIVFLFICGYLLHQNLFNDQLFDDTDCNTITNSTFQELCNIGIDITLKHRTYKVYSPLPPNHKLLSSLIKWNVVWMHATFFVVWFMDYVTLRFFGVHTLQMLRRLSMGVLLYERSEINTHSLNEQMLLYRYNCFDLGRNNLVFVIAFLVDGLR